MKQAVVYLLDASASMAGNVFGGSNNSNNASKNNTNNNNGKSRLDHAKQGILEMVSDLMLQSKTNECSVICLQTLETRHHKYLGRNSSSSHDNDDEYDNEYDKDDDDDIPFPHLTEYPAQGIRRPDVALLNQIQAVSAATTTNSNNNNQKYSKETEALVGGDFISGILLAADSLNQRTKNKKYERSIVLWTDARGYDVVLDVQQLLLAIDTLRSMECRLYVVGMDFASKTVDFAKPAEAPTSASASSSVTPHKKRPKANPDDENYDSGVSSETEKEEDGDDDDEEEEEDEDPNIRVYRTPKDRERLLRSLTEKTGGSVLAAHTMQEVLQHQRGQKLPSVATAFKAELRIAPSLTLIDVRFSLWGDTSGKSVGSSFIMEAVQIVPTKRGAEGGGGGRLVNDGNSQDELDKEDDDDDDDICMESQTQIAASIHTVGDNETHVIRTNNLGEEMLEELKEHKGLFLDPDDHNTVIPLCDTTKALRYGADILPLSTYEMEASQRTIPRPGQPTIQVLGYMPKSDIPQPYRQGKPYRIYDLQRNSRNDAALKALARALEKTQKVAIVTFAVRANSLPVLGGLFPNLCGNGNMPHADDEDPADYPLVFLRLPYAGDIKELPTHVYDPLTSQGAVDTTDAEHVQVAKQLIQKLSLSENTNLPLFPPNPFHRAWNQTRLARALDPNADPAVPSAALCEIQPPPKLVQEAAESLALFRKTFFIVPRNEKIKSGGGSGGRKKGGDQGLTFTNFL